jgi:hypothetical protein
MADTVAVEDETRSTHQTVIPRERPAGLPRAANHARDRGIYSPGLERRAPAKPRLAVRAGGLRAFPAANSFAPGPRRGLRAARYRPRGFPPPPGLRGLPGPPREPPGLPPPGFPPGLPPDFPPDGRPPDGLPPRAGAPPRAPPAGPRGRRGAVPHSSSSSGSTSDVRSRCDGGLAPRAPPPRSSKRPRGAGPSSLPRGPGLPRAGGRRSSPRS